MTYDPPDREGAPGAYPDASEAPERPPDAAAGEPGSSSGATLGYPSAPARIPIGVTPVAPAPAGLSGQGEFFATAAEPTPAPIVRNVVLFALTLATTTYWGFIQYQLFYLDDLVATTWNPFAEPMLWLAGLPYGIAVIAFLSAHEMGHYLACRYYGIQATLPYFIPIPPIGPILLPGTMGAVIRIKSPIVSRRALFDVAVAGPLAGFAVAIPIVAVGLAQSRVVENASLGAAISMGEPLIWGPLQAFFAPPVGPDQTLLAHPLAFVGWFAILVTAMNLLPIGQLDGGHLLYAVTPRHHRKISIALVIAMFVASYYFFTGWFLFALLILFALGTKHPHPLTFESSLGARRRMLLMLAMFILVTSFMLEPIHIDFG